MNARARNGARRVVLFVPRRDDPTRGEPYSADILPLEILTVAGGPVRDGFEVVLIDAMVEEDPIPRVLEACESALCFGSTAIVGPQVGNGKRVAEAVRARFPELPIVWGGWFPSVAPAMYFEAGLADAVVLGQGELTFAELVQALASGADLEEVAGLALWREGELLRTAPRPVARASALPPIPWQLFDFEPYRERQLAAGAHVRHRMPAPARWTGARPPVSFCLVSSYGCPTDCTFCCSPEFTARRWKATPGGVLAEEVLELRERFGFDSLRFQDANWGVAEKRAREFAGGLLAAREERGSPTLYWNATIEIEAVLRYADETLDALVDSGLHLMWMGAETGTLEMQERIRKHVEVPRIPEAIERLVRRDVTTGVFWIIGFPDEEHASMRSTIEAAGRTKLLFPGCASELYPFRPLPGTPDYTRAAELGWDLPASFEDWSRFFEWKWHTEDNPLPNDVRRDWRRYIQTAAHYDRNVKAGPRWMRAAVAKLAEWRLRSGNYAFPAEQKLFDLCVRRG